MDGRFNGLLPYGPNPAVSSLRAAIPNAICFNCDGRACDSFECPIVQMEFSEYLQEKRDERAN